MEIITRQEASDINQNWYFTGVPCKNGHLVKRRTKTKHCYTCHYNAKLPSVRRYNEKHKDRLNEKHRTQEYKLKRNKYLRETGYGRYSANLRTYRSQRATPKWIDLDKMREVYRNCPKGYEVDHIIPLQSDLVCGLNVHNNLQYLTKKENTSKGNHFISYIELKQPESDGISGKGQNLDDKRL